MRATFWGNNWGNCGCRPKWVSGTQLFGVILDVGRNGFHVHNFLGVIVDVGWVRFTYSRGGDHTS